MIQAEHGYILGLNLAVHYWFDDQLGQQSLPEELAKSPIELVFVYCSPSGTMGQ